MYVVEVYFLNIFDLLSFSICFCFIKQIKIIKFDGWTFLRQNTLTFFWELFMIFLRKTLFFEVCFFESVTEFEFLGTHMSQCQNFRLARYFKNGKGALTLLSMDPSISLLVRPPLRIKNSVLFVPCGKLSFTIVNKLTKNKPVYQSVLVFCDSSCD